MDFDFLLVCDALSRGLAEGYCRLLLVIKPLEYPSFPVMCFLALASISGTVVVAAEISAREHRATHTIKPILHKKCVEQSHNGNGANA